MKAYAMRQCGNCSQLVVFKSLNQAFGKYGSCHVERPIKEAAYHSPSPNRAPTQRAKATGYVYVVYKNESSVKKLMHDCSHELGAAGECYFKLKARRSQVTEVRQVQVIPWVVSDVAYMRRPPTATESRLTVFVGALHGMLTAKVLFSIMADVYGNVISVEIDTDRYKYPIGSGRVVFSSQASYFRAIDSGFLEIKTSKFSKRIQIDPYLRDSRCSQCDDAQGPYFCRERSCFRYYCLQCWQVRHVGMGLCGMHKPLTLKSRRPVAINAINNSRRSLLFANYASVTGQNNPSLMYTCGAYQPSVCNQNGIPVGFFTSHRRSGGYPPTSSSLATAPTHSPAWITPQFIRSICYHHKQATGGSKKVSLGTDVSCEVSEKKEHTGSRNNAKSDTSIGGRGFNESGEEQQVGTFSSLSPASSENVDSVISASTASPGLF